MSEKPKKITDIFKAREQAGKDGDYEKYNKLTTELYHRLKALGEEEEVISGSGDIEITAAGMNVVMTKGQEPTLVPRLRFKRKGNELTVGNTVYGKKQEEV